MEKTTGELQSLDRWNVKNFPPEGHEDVGKFGNKLWEEAKREKIERLGMHDRWTELHKKFRGEKGAKKYPVISANYIFKTIFGFIAMLTERDPIAEYRTDDEVPEEQVKALNKDGEQWWTEQDGGRLLEASVQNMGVYGAACEKFVFNRKTNTSKIIVKDPFNLFPAPGYKLCTMDLPYFCDAYFLEPYEIQDTFGVPDEIHIPADANEQLFGGERETVKGGKIDNRLSEMRNLPSNYSAITGQGQKSAFYVTKTLVVELWCKDESIEKVPIMGEVQATFDDGSPAMDDQGRPMMTQGQTGETVRERYPGGIRKITICPALLSSPLKGVLDDARNPNINWELVEMRKQTLLANGMQIPVQNPETGEQMIQAVPVDEEMAHELSIKSVSNTWLFSHYPYGITGSKMDTTQWWPFSTIEQIEELTAKAEYLLTKYLAYMDMVMFPILIIPEGSGVPKNKVTNEPGLVLRPTVEAAPHIRYVQSPNPPMGILDVVQFLLFQVDIVSGSPEVTEGRKPKGVSAASAIIALQDKATTLFSPNRKATEQVIKFRGLAHGSMVQNFGTKAKPIKVDKEYVQFVGIDLQAAFDYFVEVGSTAPITKQGRKQQYVELFRLGALGLMPFLEMLEVPRKAIEQTLEEKSVPGALEILVAAGLPMELAQSIYSFVLQAPGIGGGKGPGGKPGEGMQTTQPTGPNVNNERMKTIYKDMRTAA